MYALIARYYGTGKTVTVRTVDGALISGLVEDTIPDVVVKISGNWVAVKHVIAVQPVA